MGLGMLQNSLASVTLRAMLATLLIVNGLGDSVTVESVTVLHLHPLFFKLYFFLFPKV